MSSTTNWESQLSPQEVRAYSIFFAAANGGKPNVVTGQEAVTFFARSGIPNEILSDIWETADRDNLGYLTPETFSIALKLIACAQHGQDVGQPVLSTVVPLPQFEGINPDTASTTNADTINPSDREKYLTIFRAHHPVQGVVDGAKAREIFVKSKLSNEALAQIWSLADVRKSGNLNQTEFVIAMHYIAKMMDGSIKTLPAQLPASIYGSASGSIQSSPVLRRTSMSPVTHQATGNSTISYMSALPPRAFPIPQQQTGSWEISSQQKLQYDSYFDNLDKQRTGFVHGNEAVDFFKNSRLPDTELARVWDLADMEQRGRLTRNEFAIAMHLIQKRLAGEPLPNILPKSLAAHAHHSPSILGQSMFQSPPSMDPSQYQQTRQPPPQHYRAPPPPPPKQQQQQPDEDLLGDFGNNEQLTEDTNQVNRLQYEISNVKATIEQVKGQKQSVQVSLDQSQQQKEQHEKQRTEILQLHESETKRLEELKGVIESERPGWIQIQQEHNAASQQLQQVRDEIVEAQKALDASRQQTETLRQRVHQVQSEKDDTIALLNQLREYVKQQEQPSKPNFDDIFSPQGSQQFESSPPQQEKQVTSPSEFDAIFGGATAPAPTTTTTESKRPAPPPPPHRRTTIRRQQDQQSSTSAITKKARAPPPPPPTQTTAMVAGAGTAATAAVLATHHEIESSDDTETESSSTSSSGESSAQVAKNETVTQNDGVTLSTMPEDQVNIEELPADLGTLPESNMEQVVAETPQVQEAAEDKDQSSSKPSELLHSIVHDDEAVPAHVVETSPESEASQLEQDIHKSPDSVIEKSVTDKERTLEKEPVIEDDHVGDIAPESEIQNDESKKTTEQPVAEKEPVIEESAVEEFKTDDNDKSNDIVSDETKDIVSAVQPEEQALTKPHDDDQKDVEDNEQKETMPVADDQKDMLDNELKETMPVADDQKDVTDNEPKEAVPAVDDQKDVVDNEQKETMPVADDQKDVLDNEFKETMPVADDQKDVTDNEPKETVPAVDDQKDVVDNEPKETMPAAAAQIVSEEPTKEPNTIVDHVAEDTNDHNGAETSMLQDSEKDTHDQDGPKVTKAEELKERGIEDTSEGKQRQENDDFKDDQPQKAEAMESKDNAVDETKSTAIEESHEHGKLVGDEIPPAMAEEQQASADVSKDIQESINEPLKEIQSEGEKSTVPEAAEHGDQTTQALEEHSNDEKNEPAESLKMPGAMPGEEKHTTAPDESDEDFASARVSPVEEHPTAIESSSTNDSSDTVRPTMTDDNTPKDEQAPSASDKRESYNPFAVATSDADKKENDITSQDVKEESSTKTPVSTEKNGDDNEDFDAVFMERPTDKSKQSSFSSGENESFEMISSNASLDKSKANDDIEDEFDSAFASELHDAKMVDAPTTAGAAEAANSAFDDDFDSVFATQLMDAKVVHDQSNPFGPVPSSSTEIKDKGKEKMSWATSFGGFDFGQDDDDTKANDEWDAIFGGGDNEKKKDPGDQQGFQDTFADFGKNHDENHGDDSQAKDHQPPQKEQLSKQDESPEIQERVDTPPQPHPAFAPTGSNLDQLLTMGFDRAVAKEALDRYDQDLEKATNFLLDQAN